MDSDNSQNPNELPSFLSKINKLSKVAKTLDPSELFEFLSKLDSSMVFKMMKMAKSQEPKHLPYPDGDFYSVSEMLTPEERETQLEVRRFMDKEVKPIADEYWMKAEFPHQLIPKIGALGLAGLTYKGYGLKGSTNVLEGILAMEMARVDTSFSTFFGVQSGLSMGSIYLLGSEAQKQEYLPQMRDFKLLGAFGLTEPEVGSGAAGGLTTTCKKDGDSWILNGEKKWIGNATFSDFTIIWARNVDDDRVKGFIVHKDSPGFSTKKIENKLSLRIVQNATIKLEDVRVPESKRLANAHNFKNTSEVLRMTRAGVAWQAVGCARGAYEVAARYSQTRKQFGRPIGSFQMIQDQLAHMLGNLTAMQTMVMRLSELQDQGRLKDEHASLAKVFCTKSCKEVVGMARSIHGGNGILLENDVGRFLADAEALYSYEGTKEINSLIVGRAITGFSAFV
jgi:glutaryl-CoA dehydrogenase